MDYQQLDGSADGDDEYAFNVDGKIIYLDDSILLRAPNSWFADILHGTISFSFAFLFLNYKNYIHFSGFLLNKNILFLYLF